MMPASSFPFLLSFLLIPPEAFSFFLAALAWAPKRKRFNTKRKLAQACSLGVKYFYQSIVHTELAGTCTQYPSPGFMIYVGPTS